MWNVNTLVSRFSCPKYGVLCYMKLNRFKTNKYKHWTFEHVCICLTSSKINPLVHPYQVETFSWNCILSWECPTQFCDVKLTKIIRTNLKWRCITFLLVKQFNYCKISTIIQMIFLRHTKSRDSEDLRKFYFSFKPNQLDILQQPSENTKLNIYSFAFAIMET